MHRRTLIVGAWAVILARWPNVTYATPVASPDVTLLPAAPAPFGIATTPLPSDWASVRALFAALPESIAGGSARPVKEHVDRLIAPYGAVTPLGVPALSITALSFADGDFFPDTFTAGSFVAMAGTTDDMQATGFGRDGDIAWIATATTIGFAGDKPGTPETTTTLFTLSWGVIDSGWMFAVGSTVEASIPEIAIAFVAAARTTGEA